MFDKLIESEPNGAEFKSRRSYFWVSTVAMVIVFATAVVVSIYAADFRLGTTNFELSAILAPVEMAAPAPMAPRPLAPTTKSVSKSVLPTRQINMARVDEPAIVPNTVSTVANNSKARPNIPYLISSADTDPSVRATSGRDNGSGTSAGDGLERSTTVAKSEPLPEPPAFKEPPTKRPPTPQSLGVVNGRAKDLPKPAYPAAAISLNIQGKVDVQVTIDETGKVTSANAISGHPLLRATAEKAARSATFSPTYLSKVPVKVTGVIIYNFTR